MRILISNDDGYQARGLRTLAEHLKPIADVVVVAPDRNRSGASNSLTLETPLRVERVEPNLYYVNGTPTDCVHIAITGLLEQEPDVLISGINNGANLGDDVLYSGTVAAAMEAVTLGVPGIGISFSGGHPETMATYREMLVQLVRQITGVADFPEQTLLNVNLPGIPASEVLGIQVTKLGSRYFSESLTRMKDPWGREIFWIGGGTITWTGTENSDHLVVAEGYVSVTPLHMDLTNYSLLETVKGWSLEG